METMEFTRENRYMIGEVECFVEFSKKERETCLVRIGNKFFRISVKLLDLIASPAP